MSLSPEVSTRAYLSHLVHAKEALAVTLASLHNLRFYQALMQKIREAINEDCFESFRRDFLAGRVEAGIGSLEGESE